MSSCKPEPITDKPEKYQFIHPIVADTAYQEEYVAEINALQNVEIRTHIKGFIERIWVDEGHKVRQGQLLFTISNKAFQQDLLRAEAAWKIAISEERAAAIEWEGSKKLFAKKIIARPELDLAEAKVEAMKAKVAEAASEIAHAKLQLSYTEIRAPFEGIINRIPNKMGSLVDEGTLLTTLSDNREVLAYFHFSEKDYLNYVKSGEDKVKYAGLVLANGEPFAHTGLIETSESEFDGSTGNIAFRARFPNPDGLLKHGSNGKIVLRKNLKSALLIPQKSTFEIQDKLFVYVLKADSTLEQRNIELRHRLPHVFVIEKGLSSDEKILYEGSESVSSGMKIMPLQMGQSNWMPTIKPGKS